jgi:hypothetical protein
VRVLVNMSNIIEYGLDVITGNSRESLLIRAAQLSENGYDFYINIPDVEGGDNDAPQERNAFEHFSSDLPEPDGFTHSQEATNLAQTLDESGTDE